MHTDKATPFNYGVLQNATKSATFTEKSILLLEQWLPNQQFRFLHVLDFEAWRLHFKYMYISAISSSSTITVVYQVTLDDYVSTYFLHKSQQLPITIFQSDLYCPPFVSNAYTHP
jgi:hypothetical protein